jgi:hypothetical protein
MKQRLECALASAPRCLPEHRAAESHTAPEEFGNSRAGLGARNHSAGKWAFALRRLLCSISTDDSRRISCILIAIGSCGFDAICFPLDCKALIFGTRREFEGVRVRLEQPRFRVHLNRTPLDRFPPSSALPVVRASRSYGLVRHQCCGTPFSGYVFAHSLPPATVPMSLKTWSAATLTVKNRADFHPAAGGKATCWENRAEKNRYAR